MKTNLMKMTARLACIFCFIMLISSSLVFASTVLMSYSGTTIRDKDSVSTFTLSGTSTINVTHECTRITSGNPSNYSNYKMLVTLKKKSGLLYNETGDQFYCWGVGTAYGTWTKSAGTYRLHFTGDRISDTEWPAFDINGTVEK